LVIHVYSTESPQTFPQPLARCIAVDGPAFPLVDVLEGNNHDLDCVKRLRRLL